MPAKYLTRTMTKDSNGTALNDGDTATIIKDLKVKAHQVLSSAALP
jgi:uncharacterized Zn ribbon protein